MSDEEKKALDNMKSLLLYSKEHEYFSPFQEQEIDDMNIVLNLIEKQSKEIEELKEKNRQSKMRIVQLENEITARIEDVNKYFTPNDKIKAKIEEDNKKYKAIESNYTEQAIDDGDFELNDYVELQSIQYADDILQSLLEKE